MIINEDFFDDVDNEELHSVDQNDLENDEHKSLNPDNYEYLFIIGISSFKVTDYSDGQLENIVTLCLG